jgi:hypothetical protein
MAETVSERRDERTIVHGYGNCGYSGCECPEFAGSGQLCDNCHHNFDYH